MTTLREAAPQALDALELITDLTNHDDEIYDAIDALKTALVENAMQKFADVDQELEAALAEPVLQTCNCRWDGEMQMQQCTLHEAHVDAIKEWAQRAKFAEKKLAALAEQRLTDVQQEMERSIESLKAALAEPVQEPVAWVLALPDGRLDRLSVVAYDDEAEEMLQRSIAGCTLVPLYTSPPQRKPLTEEEIEDLYFDKFSMGELKAFARAIERAHGIT